MEEEQHKYREREEGSLKVMTSPPTNNRFEERVVHMELT